MVAAQLDSDSDGWFVRHTLPVGTVVSGDKATLPDGRIVSLKNFKDPTTGRVLKPWEMDWANEPAIPKQSQIHWLSLLGATVYSLLWFGACLRP